MRRKRLSRVARDDIQRIAAHLAAHNPAAAERYYQAALDTFFALPDNLTPKRASDRLPEHVRELQVAGFRGYLLRIARRVVLLAAFAPGLPDQVKDSRTRKGMRRD